MEQWRDIPGYEGIYQASTLGNIRTCEGKTTSNKRYAVRRWKQRTLNTKFSKRRCGGMDARVTLWKDGDSKDWLVARLVGITWCAGYEPSMTVNHINGNPLDNRADNLEWISLADNIRHAYATSLNSCAEKTKLISVNSAEEFEFFSKAEASRFLGRNHGYINNCLRSGRRARSITGDVYTIS